MDTQIISTSVASGQSGVTLDARSSSESALSQKVQTNEQLSEAGPSPTEQKPAADAVGTEVSRSDAVDQAKEIVERLNTQALSYNRALRFSVDEDVNTPIISVVDRETNEVIRQIPSETALKIAEAFSDITAGQLLTEQA